MVHAAQSEPLKCKHYIKQQNDPKEKKSNANDCRLGLIDLMACACSRNLIAI